MRTISPGNDAKLKSADVFTCEASYLASGASYSVPRQATAYGHVVEGRIEVGDIMLPAGFFFSVPNAMAETRITAGSDVLVALFVRFDFVGQIVFGRIEDAGRINYLNGCTDTILVGPPRAGDPCLNSLHFPVGVDQSFHTHPSARLGVVTAGCGVATLRPDQADERELELNPGDIFIIEPGESHRFRTNRGQPMTVVSMHPDSDWGPTDADHPMMLRTYLQ